MSLFNILQSAFSVRYFKVSSSKIVRSTMYQVVPEARAKKQEIRLGSLLTLKTSFPHFNIQNWAFSIKKKQEIRGKSRDKNC